MIKELLLCMELINCIVEDVLLILAQISELILLYIVIQNTAQTDIIYLYTNQIFILNT